MARLFPLRSETPQREGQPRVVDLEGEDADAVFSALSSTTARQIYTTLHDEPGTPSDVAESIDSSIQNVRYHLEKLEGAGLVEVVDTWYSSRGNEMSVYATANGPLIVTSDQSKAAQLKAAISRFIGGLAALAGGSLLVQHAAGQFFTPGVSEAEAPPPDDGAAADDAATDEDDPSAPTDDDAETAADDDTEADADAAGDDAPADDTDEEDVGIFDADDDEPARDEEPEEDLDEEVEADEPTADDVEDDAPADDAADVPVDDPDTGDNVTFVTDASPDALEAASTLPPGLLFFLGGFLVLTLVTAYWYWSAPRLA